MTEPRQLSAAELAKIEHDMKEPLSLPRTIIRVLLASHRIADEQIKELEAKLASVILELARLRVKPIVDKEKKFENLDGVMEIRFRG